MQAAIKNMVMGNKTPEELFKMFWEDYGMKGVKTEQGQTITVPVQRVLHRDNKEVLAQNKGMVRKAITKQMTASEVQSHVPLIYDPEILGILKSNAPFKERVAKEGQQGYKAVFNYIHQRDDPIGFKSESDVLDLTSTSGKNIKFEKGEVDMTIYVDLVDISDFTQAAAEHYVNVEDTTFGERLALYAQRLEQQMLYGDKSQDTDSGYLGDANSFNGLAKLAADASNDVDRSSIDKDFAKDIKSYIHDIMQNEAVNINDLVIVTSWTFFDKITSELVPNQIRYAAVPGDTNVGIEQLRIAGVPVMATHNVSSYTDGDYSIGDENDVFIVNMRAIRHRQLVPLSTVPLGRLGLSERTAIFEFGAMIDRTEGNWIRYLKSYDGGAST